MRQSRSIILGSRRRHLARRRARLLSRSRGRVRGATARICHGPHHRPLVLEHRHLCRLDTHIISRQQTGSSRKPRHRPPSVGKGSLAMLPHLSPCSVQNLGFRNQHFHSYSCSKVYQRINGRTPAKWRRYSTLRLRNKACSGRIPAFTPIVIMIWVRSTVSAFQPARVLYFKRCSMSFSTFSWRSMRDGLFS